MGVTVTNTAVCVMCKHVRIANVKQAGHQRGVKGSAYQRAAGTAESECFAGEAIHRVSVLAAMGGLGTGPRIPSA